MQAVVRKVRSLSPFRRRKTARELINDVEQKEKNMMTELAEKRSNLAAIEVMLDEESTPNQRMTKKSMKRIPSSKVGGYKSNLDSDTATPVTASTEDDSPNRPRRSGYPIPQLNRQQTFRDRFKRIRSLKSKKEAEDKLRSAPEIPRTVTSRGRSLRRDDEPHDELHWLPTCMPSSASVAVASTEGVGMAHPFDEDDAASRLTKVSELSSPITLQRAESLGNDSIAEIRDVLQKMERRLQNAEQSGSRISRAQVIKALMKVADSVDSLDERDAVYRELANMVEGHPIENTRAREIFMSSFDEEDDEESSDDSSSGSESDGETDSFDASTLQPEMSAFDFFASFGNFFSPSARDDKTETRQVLDDLLSFEKTRGSRDCRDEEEESKDGRSREWEESPYDSSSSSDQERSSMWVPPSITARPDSRSRVVAKLHSRACSPITQDRRKVNKDFIIKGSGHRSRRAVSPSSDEDSGATPANAHQRLNLERLPSFNYHETNNTRPRHFPIGTVIY